ncbi:hypothetical protein [Pseudoprimorskyibacter insulae]|uniref:Heme oxygenase n=1 Tax=Pseudoprimorskyibacter insulae TaxID=1695997 RepID=A0A2R8AQ62_9RHOB|nr:hypothetical protein [Pseudoprimorskyibacter insulae]SPF78172.1 hypothetical protein PRI8871_00765 [Pseudoprimorskyibacter insulae]
MLDSSAPVKDQVSFRTILRTKTRHAHDKAELSFARFRADAKRNLGWFLASQRAGLGALRASGIGVSTDLRARLLIRLDADLIVHNRPLIPVRAAQELDPLAVDYIILGSRLGTEVLRRQVFQSGDAIPLYFQTGPEPQLWRTLCDDLALIDPGSARASAILRDTRTAFDIFEHAAQAQVDHPGDHI